MDETPPKKIRLFTALPVPADVKERLGALPRKGLEARWTHPDDLHITLRFLGDIDPGGLPEIRERLGRVRRPPFHIEIGGLGSFRTGRQVIFWAAVHSTRKLTALAGDINESLEPLGFEMPNKPYRPHITLARLKNPQGLDRYAARHGKDVSFHWEATAFGLFLSAEPDEKGSRYSALDKYTLPLSG